MFRQKKFNAPLLMAVFAGGFSIDAAANGLRVVSQDAFAAARGEAFVATADNASAVYYNPAGITQLEGNDLRAGLYALHLDPTFTPPPGKVNSGQVYSTGKHYAGVPDFFFTHQLKEIPVTLGLGIYAPYGGGISWPEDTRFRSVATRSSLTYLRFNPVVAVKLSDTLSLAAGASVDYAKLKLEQGILKSSNPLNYFRFTGDGFTAGWNAGILWQPHEKFSLGGTVRGETAFTLEGETAFAEEGAFPAGTRGAQTDFTFPLTAVLGISFRPTPKWNLEFDVDYTDWSSVGQLTLQQSQPATPSGIQQNIPVKLFWQASWMYEFGVTRYFENGWHASAGYLFNENSVPDAYYSPLVTDLDRHFFTIGVGHRGEKWDWDLTYQLGYGPPHTVSGSTPSSTPGQFAGQTADGTYEFMSHAIFVTVGKRF